MAALCLDRLLVPVVATATRMGQTAAGLTSDKEAEMAVVLLQAADGRRALLAFSGLDCPAGLAGLGSPGAGDSGPGGADGSRLRVRRQS